MNEQRPPTVIDRAWQEWLDAFPPLAAITLAEATSTSWRSREMLGALPDPARLTVTERDQVRYWLDDRHDDLVAAHGDDLAILDWDQIVAVVAAAVVFATPSAALPLAIGVFAFACVVGAAGFRTRVAAKQRARMMRDIQRCLADLDRLLRQ